MIRMNVRIDWDGARLRRRVQRESQNRLRRGAGAIRLTARRSMKRRKGKSAKGQPPHAHEGGLKRSVAFARVDRDTYVIGPRASFVDQAGQRHEFGGRYQREYYDRRPFMGPALEKMRPQLPEFWANVV